MSQRDGDDLIEQSGEPGSDESDPLSPLADGGRTTLMAVLAPTSINAISAEMAAHPAGCAPGILTSRLAETPPFRTAGLWLAEPDRAGLCRHALHGAGLGAAGAAPEDGDELVHLPWGALGSVLETPRPTQVNGMGIARKILPRSAFDALQTLGAGGRIATTFSGIPLEHAGMRLGLLGLFSVRRLSDDELALLQLLGGHVAAELGASNAAPVPMDQHSAEYGPPASFDDFTALVTHELRSPLTGLRGNVQLASMAARKGDYHRIGTRLEAALHSVDAITALVQNLQDMSRLDRGIFALSPAPADLTATIWQAVQRVERAIAVDRHAVTVVAPEPIIVSHDARQMEHVFYNLLTNAISYSPDGGTVEVRAERTAEAVVVTIRDEGMGITPAEQQRIFEPYMRGSTARTAQGSGLGLGLAVSRATVERHGGTIDVRSHPGQGSTFTVRIPLSSGDQP